MPNVQFCPVCGYALKRLDTQCGRCGETVAEEPEQLSAPPRRRSSTARTLGDYSIEAIGAGGDVEASPSSLQPAARDYGIRDINQRSARNDYSGRGVQELQKELRDLNERIAKMDEAKRHEAPRVPIEPQAVQLSRVMFKSDVVKHFRRRSDTEFKSIVAKHVAAMQETVHNRVSEKRGSEPAYHMFIDDKIVSPGVYDSSVVLFVGPAGSMKSTMAAYTVAQMARKSGSKAVYMLLDESKSKFENRLGKLNIITEADPIRVKDGSDIRENTADMTGNWRRVMMEYLRMEYRRKPFQFLVMDNLNAMHSMVRNENERRATFEFFDWVRTLGLTTIVVREGEYSMTVHSKGAEAYLADGVVQFHRRKRGDGALVPMFRVLKMRGAEIDSRYFALQVSSGNLRFVSAVAT